MAGGHQLNTLVAALHETPIPTAPPAADNQLAVLGLNLLDLALNQEHIGRMSETLTMTDATHLTRQVGLEIELAGLAPARLAALAHDRGSVWLPLTRQPRRNSGTVTVSDIEGRQFPTMSTRQTEQALIHGLRKVFAAYFEAAADGSEVLRSVRDEFHRSRWLIEATIASVIEHGRGVERARVPGGNTDAWAIRDRAEAVLGKLFEDGSAFLRMLDIAATEHLLVVRVPTEPTQLTLRFDDPGVLETSTDYRRSRFRREFTVRYRTVIPREVNTYDVTVDVPEGIQVRRFFLAAATDRAAVRALADDMRSTANRYDLLAATSTELLQLELHGIASRLAELGRRRERDLRAFRTYIENCYAAFSPRPPKFPGPPQADDPDALLMVSRQIVTRLAQFAARYEADQFRRFSEDTLSAETLRAWAYELESADLDMSLDFDRDPREHMARVRWQRREFGDEPATSEPVEANLYMSLVDDPISLSSGVTKLVLAVLLLVAAFALLLRPDLLAGVPLLDGLTTRVPLQKSEAGQTMSSADAVVTVLLLVPALLISRTRLPPRSLLGRLLIWPRFVAYASVISVVLLALCVASLPADALEFPFLLVMAILTLLLLLIMVDFTTKTMMRRSRVPAYEVIPAWLHREGTRRRRKRFPRCVANFSSTEREDDD
jgi:hypothetical protein